MTASPRRFSFHSETGVLASISRQPVTTSTAASTEMGMYASSHGRAPASTSSHAPCSTADRRVRAPASTLAAERTITPVIGKAPASPQRVLPMPCAASSLS
jgi:hypothetical protein